MVPHTLCRSAGASCQATAKSGPASTKASQTPLLSEIACASSRAARTRVRSRSVKAKKSFAVWILLVFPRASRSGIGSTSDTQGPALRDVPRDGTSAPTSLSRIVDLDAIKLGGQQATASQSRRDTDGQTQDHLGERTAEYQAKDVSALGAERHAEANLADPSGDRVGRDAVEAHAGQCERQQTK